MRPIALLAACLSACAPAQWEKAGTAPEQLSRDDADCRRQAKVQAAARSGPNNASEPYFARGSIVVPTGAGTDPLAHQMIAENRLAQDCMEARGYKLGPVKP